MGKLSDKFKSIVSAAKRITDSKPDLSRCESFSSLLAEDGREPVKIVSLSTELEFPKPARNFDRETFNFYNTAKLCAAIKNMHIKDNDILSCTICSDSYFKVSPEGELEHPVVTPCGHIFGNMCLDIWRREQKALLAGHEKRFRRFQAGEVQCPTCRFHFPYAECRNWVNWDVLTEKNLYILQYQLS
jgi:hypothetical protein